MAIRASYAQVPTCVLGCPASEARRAVDVLDGIARPRGWSSLLLRVFASGILLQGCCFGVIASGTQNATRVLGCPASEARLGVDVLERHHGLARHRTATRVSRPPSMAKQKPLKQKREAETQTGEAETRVVLCCFGFLLQGFCFGGGLLLRGCCFGDTKRHKTHKQQLRRRLRGC